MRGGQGGAGRAGTRTVPPPPCTAPMGRHTCPASPRPAAPCPDTSRAARGRGSCAARGPAQRRGSVWTIWNGSARRAEHASCRHGPARGAGRGGRGGGRRTGRCSACWTPRPRWSRPSPGRPWWCSMLVYGVGPVCRPAARPAPCTVRHGS